METQTVINAVIGVIGTIIGALLKAVWDAVKDLQKADKDLAKDVGSLQVLVAGDYIRRDEFSKIVETLFAKLDKIDAKLDTKANASECPTKAHHQ